MLRQSNSFILRVNFLLLIMLISLLLVDLKLKKKKKRKKKVITVVVETTTQPTNTQVQDGYLKNRKILYYPNKAWQVIKGTTEFIWDFVLFVFSSEEERDRIAANRTQAIVDAMLPRL